MTKTTTNFRASIYFEPSLYKELLQKAEYTNHSISKIVNDAVRQLLREDQLDLQAFNQRRSEHTLTYNALLKSLKMHGKL